MLLTIQPVFMSRHEISVATSTGVFSLYFFATTNSLVDTWLVHETIIPCHDIVFLLHSVVTRDVFFQCRDIQNDVATISFFEAFSPSSYPVFYHNILILASVSLLVATLILYRNQVL